MDSFPYDLDLLTSIVNAERKSLGSRFDELLKLCITKHSEELAKKLAEIDHALRCNAHPAESMARAIWMGDQELIVPSLGPRPEFIFPGVSEMNIAGHTLQLPISMPYVDGGFLLQSHAW